MNTIHYAFTALFASVLFTSCGMLEQARLDQEYTSDPSWIACSTSAGAAKWAYFPKKPTKYAQAIWTPCLSNYGPTGNWTAGQMFRAEGPGKIEFNRNSLSLSNMFDSERTLLEVTGDWKEGRLVRVHSVYGTEAGNPLTYNWDAINTGIALGAAPFIAAGKVIKDGLETTSTLPDGVMDCAMCKSGDINYEAPNFLGHTTYHSRKCEKCNGTGWLRYGQPYTP